MSDAAAEPFTPSILTPALVAPLSIYAGGRKSFEAITRCEINISHAKAMIFTRMMLERFGWSYRRTNITPAGRDKNGFPIWKLSKG
jgi:hypothetical protein